MILIQVSVAGLFIECMNAIRYFLRATRFVHVYNSNEQTLITVNVKNNPYMDSTDILRESSVEAEF